MLDDDDYRPHERRACRLVEVGQPLGDLQTPRARPSSAAPTWGFLDRHGRAVVLGAAALLFVGGTIVSFRMGSELRYLDEREYYQLAKNLVAGGRFTFDGVTPTALRPPGHPALLAALMVLGAGVPALRAANFAALALSMLLVRGLAARLAGGVAATLAPLALVCYPVALYTATTLYPQTVAATLLLAALWLMARREPPRWSNGLGAGILLGALVLSVPIFVFSVGLIAGTTVWSHRRAAVRSVAPMLAAAALVIGAWSARNDAALGTPVFVSTNSGLNLLLGNSADTRPDSGVNVDLHRYVEQDREVGEVAVNAYYKRSAIAWMSTHKGAAAWLYVRKVLHYFGITEQVATERSPGSWRAVVMLVTYGPLLVLLGLRLLSVRRDPVGPVELPLIALYLGSALVMAVFFTRIRFRVPLDYVLVALATAHAVRITRRPRPAGSTARPGSGEQLREER